MLLDVITRLSADLGIHIDQKRTTLIELANQGAKELHKELECNKIYREVTLVVPIDKVVSLPGFIGELKGMRIHTNEIPFDLHSLGAPRYVTNTLGYKFRNWRDLGESPVHTLVSAVGPLTLVANAIEIIPVSVLVDGQTNLAQRIQEVVVMDSSPKQTTNMFGPSIYSIACASKSRIADIVVKDINGVEVATLANINTKTRYKVVDVSTVFWTLDTGDGQSLIDVLYKLPAYNLVQDSDSFYAGDDYDEAWYNICMFFYLKPLQNRLQDALAHRASCMDFLQSAKESGEGAILKKITFGRGKYYGIFRRWKWFPGSLTNVDHYPPSQP